MTTGTGSGKSLTYLVPIYDHILRNQPEKSGVRAIIVYPMNALINSQWEALKLYAKSYPENQVRFDRNLTERSKLAQFLSSRKTWNLAADLAATDREPFIRVLVKVLNGNFLLLTKTHTQKKKARSARHHHPGHSPA